MVSVIIPFYNARGTLLPLVEHLKSQSLSAEDFEIIFIDNLSTDNGSEKIDVLLRNSSVQYYILKFDKIASSYAARNFGVRKAKGEILAFTDADCKPGPNWLKNITDLFSDNNSSKLIVSGRVDLEVEDSKNVWELFDYHFHMDNQRAEKNARVATANMAVQTSFFEVVGQFEEVSSGGDHKWSEMAKKAGGVITYDPSVLVKHPTRKKKSAILKKVKRTSAGLGELSRSSASAFVKGLLKTLLRPLLFHRHIEFAVSRGKSMGATFKMKLLSTSFYVRCHQVPAFFKGVLKR